MEFGNDVLKNLQETAIRANGALDKVVFKHLGEEPAFIYHAVKADGSFEVYESHPFSRGHALASLPETWSIATIKGGPSTVVWYSETQVCVIFDDGTRRDYAALELNKTPEFETLQELETVMAYGQKEFVRLLRISLQPCRSDDRLLAFARSCKFNSASSTGGTIQQGKVSLGRDITQSVASDTNSECPEECVFNVRVFSNPTIGDTFPVKCAVDFRFDEAQFVLQPYPGQLKAAVDFVVDQIGRQIVAGLADAQKGSASPFVVPVFHGSP